MTENVIRVVGRGQPNLAYTVEATGNLSDAGKWFPLAMPQADGSGVLDKEAKVNPGRCYRVSSQ